MRVSARTRYALQLLVYLALRDGKKMIQVKEVSQKEHIPLKYLEQVIRPLKQAGFLKVSRGAHGGYALGRDAGTISVGDIFAVLDDGVVTAPSASDDTSPDGRALNAFWRDFETAVNCYLSKVSVADLARKQLDLSMLMSFYI